MNDFVSSIANLLLFIILMIVLAAFIGFTIQYSDGTSYALKLSLTPITWLK